MKITFEKRNHRYKLNGKIVPSATTILGVIAKPGLLPWAVNQCVAYLEDNLKPGEAFNDEMKTELLRIAKGEHRRIKKEAADIGSTVHEWIKKWVQKTERQRREMKKPRNLMARNGASAFLNWIDEHRVEILDSERIVGSEKYQYAGTLDAIALIKKKIALVDFKTSNNIWPEYYLQTAAYQQAYEEMGLGKLQTRWIIRLGKQNGKFEAIEIKDYKNDWKGFRAALELYNWQKSTK